MSGFDGEAAKALYKPGATVNKLLAKQSTEIDMNT
jgi:hypothetical protein